MYYLIIIHIYIDYIFYNTKNYNQHFRLSSFMSLWQYGTVGIYVENVNKIKDNTVYTL